MEVRFNSLMSEEKRKMKDLKNLRRFGNVGGLDFMMRRVLFTNQKTFNTNF